MNDQQLVAMRQMETLLLQCGSRALDIKWLRDGEHRSFAYRLTGLKLSSSVIADYFGIRSCAESNQQQSILVEWKMLVDEFGLQAFNPHWLAQHRLIAVYSRAQKRGVSVADAVASMGYESEYAEYTSHIGRNGGTLWNADIFDAVANDIINLYGTIPGFEYLLANGFGGFCGQVYNFSSGIEDVRKKFGVQNVVLESLDHQSWRSLPEVAFANYLLARGVLILPGRRYPPAYAETYNRDHGIYDNHFIGRVEPYIGCQISTEIWGGGPRKLDVGDRYEETRKFKEEFHQDDPHFLGVEYSDCYKEATLKQILLPYIGDPPVLVQHPTVQVPTTMLSVADSLISDCKDLCSNLPIGRQDLPSLNWLLRRGNHANRTVFAWEKASWGPLVTLIRKVGFAHVRAALNEFVPQEVTWGKSECVDQFERLLREHNRTASSLKLALRAKFKSEGNMSHSEKQLLLEVNYLDKSWRQHFSHMGRQSIETIRAVIQAHRDTLPI